MTTGICGKYSTEMENLMNHPLPAADTAAQSEKIILKTNVISLKRAALSPRTGRSARHRDAYIERTWAEIDLDCVIESCRVIREEMVPAGTKLMAVLKSDAYGHGAACLAPILENECGVDYFAVACLSEAVELRKSGVRLPILILGLTESKYAGLLGRYHLTQTVGDFFYAKELSDAASLAGVTVNCHIKVNTGMNRLGFGGGWSDPSGAPDGMADSDDTGIIARTAREILAAVTLPGLTCDGLYSHLYNSLTYDERSKKECYAQHARFTAVRDRLASAGFTVPYCHLLNTGGVVNYPELAMDMVRVGSLLWGLKGVSPGAVQRWNPPLRPAFQLKSRVAMLRDVAAGECVGYSSNFIADRPAKVAVVSCGYTDGYSRRNSNRGFVLIRGQRVPVIGNVCMDMLLADVTDLPETAVGDLVTLYGTDGEAELSCGEAAIYADTIEPEITTVVSRRVPRLYLRSGNIVHVEDYLLDGVF